MNFVCRIAITTLLLLTLCQGIVAQDTAELDTLANICIKTYSTEEGLKNCQTLMYKAKMSHQMTYYYKAARLKVTSLIAMGRYDEAIEACDNIEQNSNIANNDPQIFNTLLIQRASGLLMTGRTDEAINTARRVYDNSKTMDSEGRNKLHVGALKIMAVACFVGKQYEASEKYFDEGIDMCRQFPAELHTNFIDLSFCKFVNLLEVISQKNDEEIVNHIREFENNVNEYAAMAHGNRPDEAIKRDLMFYSFIVKSNWLHIKARQQDMQTSERLMRSIDSLYAACDLVRMRKNDFYSAKVQYYVLTAQYDKALQYNDSVLSEYIDDNDQPNAYRTMKNKIEILGKAGMLNGHYPTVELLIDMADTIIAQTTSQSVQQMSAQMELDKSTTEITTLQALLSRWRTTAIISLIIIALLAIIMTRMIVRNTRLQHK